MLLQNQEQGATVSLKMASNLVEFRVCDKQLGAIKQLWVNELLLISWVVVNCPLAKGAEAI